MDYIITYTRSKKRKTYLTYTCKICNLMLNINKHKFKKMMIKLEKRYYYLFYKRFVYISPKFTLLVSMNIMKTQVNQGRKFC